MSEDTKDILITVAVGVIGVVLYALFNNNN